MEIIRDFTKLGKRDVSIAGGKGASLGEMTQAGIPVPPGFVILSESFERFIKETELIAEIDACLDSVNHEEIHTVEKASEKIKALIMKEEIPKDISKEIIKNFEKLGSRFVAVRSSATSEDSASAAWAGQLDSYLNTTKKTLLENVKKCWSSLFTPRAIFYRFEKNLQKEKVSVAVVVQKMIESRESGIAFSVHPVTQDYNQLIIEAGFGLGEAIVSGQITPDSYIVDKRNFEIIEKNISTQTRGIYRKKAGGNEWRDIPEKEGGKQVLSEPEIIELSKLIVRIQNHYKFPVDVEWAREAGKFYIVQSRPITTLTEREGVRDEGKGVIKKNELIKIFSRENSLIYFSLWNESDRKITKIYGKNIKNNLFIIPHHGEPGTVWYEKKEFEELKNLYIEKLKNISPLWKQIKNLSLKSWNFLEPYAKREKIIRNNSEFLEYYKNLVGFWSCLNSIVFQIIDNNKINENILNSIIEFRDKTQNFTEVMSRLLTDYLKKYPALEKIYDYVTIGEAIDVITGKMSNTNLKKIKSRVNGCFIYDNKIYLIDQIHEILNKNNLFFEEDEISNKYFNLSYTRDRQIITQHGWFYGNTSGISKLINKKLDDIPMLYYYNDGPVEIWDNNSAVDKIQNEILEINIKDNLFIKKIIKKFNLELDSFFNLKWKMDFTEDKKELVKYADKVYEMSPYYVFIYYSAINNKTPILAKKEALKWREKDSFFENNSKFIERSLEKIYPQLRNYVLYIKKDEILNPPSAEILEKRKKHYISVPGFFDETIAIEEFLEKHPEFKFLKEGIDNSGVINGEIAQGGKVTGKVHILKTRENMDKVLEGEILVSPMTIPEFLPAMKRASAIVTDEGGLMSHAAIVARELKKPCIVGTKIATKVLHDGDLVEVDANEGVVKIIERAKEKKQKVYDNKIGWELYLSRPFSLFGSSIWDLWYSSDETKKILGQNFPKGLFVENPKGISRHYREKEDINKFLKVIEDLLLKDPKRLQKMLQEGLKINKKAKKNIDKNEFTDFNEAVKFLINLTVYSALIPHFTGENIIKFKIKNKELIKLTKELREVSYYPNFYKNVILELAKKELKRIGGDEKNIDYITYEELKNKNINNIKERLNHDKSGKSYVYQKINGEEVIYYTDKPDEIINNIENKDNFDTTITGMSTYKGLVRGKVRLVLTNLLENAKLEENEIMVAIHTSPNLVPLMKKASAIITDEGGVGSHAAIISRELKIPCIIGTRIATQVLHDGDLVEVDANEGVVRILERGGKIEDKTQRIIEGLQSQGKWVQVVYRDICLLIRDLIREGEISKKFNKALRYNIPPIGDANIGNGVFSPVKSIDDVVNSLKKRTESGDFSELVKMRESCFETAKKLHSYIQKNSDYKDSISLIKTLKDIKDLYTDLTAYLLVIVFSEKFLESKIEELIKEKTGSDNKHYFEHLVYVKRLTKATEELISILKIADEIKTKKLSIDNTVIMRKIKEHAEDFGWISTRWKYEEPWNSEDIKIRILNYLKGNPKEELEKIYDFRSVGENITNEFINKYKLNKKDKDLIELTKDFVYLRTFRTESIAKANFLMKPILERIAKELGITLNDLIFLSIDEICLAIEGKFDLNIIKERQKGYDMVLVNDEIMIFTGSEINLLRELEEFKIKEDTKLQQNSITGQMAWRGKVKGPVKIIRDVTDIVKVKEGDILVATMTFPNYIPAMERAVAFVTDEGGILCHAAIIAREMKKPCIIGTKIATQVLHDGDLIEVDADNGVVKILKRCENRDESLSKDPTFIDGERWNISVSRNMSFWHQVLSDQGHFHNMKDFGIKPLRILNVTNNSTETHLFLPENNKEYFKSILETISSKQKVEKLKQNYIKYSRELLNSLNICDKNLNFKNWNRFISSYRKLCAGLYITITIGRSGSDLLFQELKNYFPEEKIPEVISLITYPVEHTPLFDSQKELLDIGKDIQGGKLLQKNIESRLKKWLEKYGFIPVNFCEQPWTIDDIKLQLNAMLEKNCKEELKSMNDSNETRLKKSKEILKKISNKKITILANALAEGTYLNEFRKNVISRVSLGYRKIFQKIIEKTGGNNWRDGFYLTPEEMGEIVKGKKFDLDKIKQERKEIGMYIDNEGNLKFIEKDKLQRLELFLLDLHGKKKDETPLQVSEFKGFSANKGKVTGIVKVILSSKDFHKINRNDILVTTMTSVDFVPIMEKAAAFVTNEGGITSHAAIVSREMNKPAIIGTKIATQVLHDGDLVEVDADHGVVKIIKKV